MTGANRAWGRREASQIARRVRSGGTRKTSDLDRRDASPPFSRGTVGGGRARARRARARTHVWTPVRARRGAARLLRHDAVVVLELRHRSVFRVGSRTTPPRSVFERATDRRATEAAERRERAGGGSSAPASGRFDPRSRRAPRVDRSDARARVGGGTRGRRATPRREWKTVGAGARWSEFARRRGSTTTSPIAGQALANHRARDHGRQERQGSHGEGTLRTQPREHRGAPRSHPAPSLDETRGRRRGTQVRTAPIPPAPDPPPPLPRSSPTPPSRRTCFAPRVSSWAPSCSCATSATRWPSERDRSVGVAERDAIERARRNKTSERNGRRDECRPPRSTARATPSGLFITSHSPSAIILTPRPRYRTPP